jgi:hypothetical protein
MRGAPESPKSGKINIDLQRDEQRTVLADGVTQQVLRSHSVAGKMLAADLLDLDSLQNHFLLSDAGLGVTIAPSIRRRFGCGWGNAVELTPGRISAFFFDILQGRIAVRTLDVRFSLTEIADNLPPETEVAQ